MTKRSIPIFIAMLLAAAQAVAFEVRYKPLYPSLNDEITIEIHGADQGAILHWGVNAVGALL